VSSATVTKAEPKATITEPKAPFLSHKRSDSHTHGVSEHFRTRSTARNYDQRVGHTNGAETPLYYSNIPNYASRFDQTPLADSHLVTDGRWKINSPYATLGHTYGSKSHLKAGSYRASHSVLVTVVQKDQSRDQSGAPKAIVRCATLHHSPTNLIRDPQAPFV
jgi:hypothetical protein